MDRTITTQLVEALEAAIPLLIRLGDFIGNGEITGPGSLGIRCDVILSARAAIRAAKECSHNEMVPNDDPGHVWKCARCGYVYGGK